MYDRLIELRPNEPFFKVEKAVLVTYYETGNVTAVKAAFAALPASIANDRPVLSQQLSFALVDHDWPKQKKSSKS